MFVVAMCVCELNDGHNKNDNTIDMFLIFMHFHHPLFLYSSMQYNTQKPMRSSASSITIIFFIHHYLLYRAFRICVWGCFACLYSASAFAAATAAAAAVAFFLSFFAFIHSSLFDIFRYMYLFRQFPSFYFFFFVRFARLPFTLMLFRSMITVISEMVLIVLLFQPTNTCTMREHTHQSSLSLSLFLYFYVCVCVRVFKSG